MKIKIRTEALDDIEQIQSFIYKENPQAAKRIIEQIFLSISFLSEQPYLGRLGVVESTREKVVAMTPYIIIYLVTDYVDIVAVFDTRRDYLSLISERESLV